VSTGELPSHSLKKVEILKRGDQPELNWWSTVNYGKGRGRRGVSSTEKKSNASIVNDFQKKTSNHKNQTKKKWDRVIGFRRRRDFSNTSFEMRRKRRIYTGWGAVAKEDRLPGQGEGYCEVKGADLLGRNRGVIGGPGRGSNRLPGKKNLMKSRWGGGEGPMDDGKVRPSCRC